MDLGRDVDDELNHTSRSFSGPVSDYSTEPNHPIRHHIPSNAFVESTSAVTSRLIIKCGVPLKEDGDAV